jgi:hypothetical protein
MSWFPGQTKFIEAKSENFPFNLKKSEENSHLFCRYVCEIPCVSSLCRPSKKVAPKKIFFLDFLTFFIDTRTPALQNQRRNISFLSYVIGGPKQKTIFEAVQETGIDLSLMRDGHKHDLMLKVGMLFERLVSHAKFTFFKLEIHLDSDWIQRRSKLTFWSIPLFLLEEALWSGFNQAPQMSTVIKNFP